MPLTDHSCRSLPTQQMYRSAMDQDGSRVAGYLISLLLLALLALLAWGFFGEFGLLVVVVAFAYVAWRGRRNLHHPA